MHPSGAVGTNVGAAPGSAQSQVRTPDASLHVRQGDCGVRRIAAPTGLDRIAECTLGTLRFKDPSVGQSVHWRPTRCCPR
eukprot:7843085-Alexandrium_andersonii.AAC.1